VKDRRYAFEMATGGGLTHRAAAEIEHGTANPTEAQLERSRRKLERLKARGLALRRDGATYHDPSAYFPAPTPVREGPGE